MVDYLSEIPDPDGSRYNSVHALQVAADPTVAGSYLPLRLFRAICTRGLNKTFTLGPLGYNSMRLCLESVNSRLPEYSRLQQHTLQAIRAESLLLLSRVTRMCPLRWWHSQVNTKSLRP